MRRYVCVQFTVILIQRIRHCLRCTAQQKIRKIERRFSSGGHGTDTADAGDDNIFTGELFRPLPDSHLDLFVGYIAVEIVSTADRFRATEFRLHDLNMHLAQETADRRMHLRLVPVTAGIVHGDGHPAVIRQYQPFDPVQHFPDRDGVDAGMQEGGCIGVNLFAVPLHTAAGTIDNEFADVIYLSEVEYGVGADAVEGDLRGVGEGSGEVFELLCFAEVAESLHDGVACPALDGMVERDVPAGVDGEIMLPFAVGGSP